MDPSPHLHPNFVYAGGGGGGGSGEPEYLSILADVISTKISCADPKDGPKEKRKQNNLNQLGCILYGSCFLLPSDLILK